MILLASYIAEYQNLRQNIATAGLFHMLYLHGPVAQMAADLPLHTNGGGKTVRALQGGRAA